MDGLISTSHFVFRDSRCCKVVEMVKELAEWCGAVSSEVADPWDGEHKAWMLRG